MRRILLGKKQKLNMGQAFPGVIKDFSVTSFPRNDTVIDASKPPPAEPMASGSPLKGGSRAKPFLK
jgi:hypothetical protein